MKMTGAQIMLECLAREGVELVFGIPGGSTLPFYDAFRYYPRSATFWSSTSSRRPTLLMVMPA